MWESFIAFPPVSEIGCLLGLCPEYHTMSRSDSNMLWQDGCIWTILYSFLYSEMLKHVAIVKEVTRLGGNIPQKVTKELVL
jgi:hypothetical protein